MRKKSTKLKLTDSHSRKVVELLLMRNGDDTLYDLCQYSNLDPASFRRKLEKENGWKEIEHINGILDYFQLSYEAVFRNEKYDWVKQVNILKEEIKKKDDIINTLREAMATILGVDKSIISTQSKKSQQEKNESVINLLHQDSGKI